MKDYKDPIIAKLIAVLEEQGPSELKGHYYHGEILALPKGMLPAVSISKDTTNIRPADNMTDEHFMPLIISVLYDWTNDINNSEEIVAGVTGLYELCEARDEDYQLKRYSLAYVFRDNITLDNDMWLTLGPGQELEIDYGFGVDRRGPGTFSVEATIRASVTLHKVRVSKLNP